MMRTQKQTVAGTWLGLFMVAVFIGVPLAEIAVFIQVGGRIGLGPTLALVVLTAIVGVWMLRRQGIGVLMRAQRLMAENKLPVVEVFEGLCLVIAGALLLTPGFQTDALGALLLIPRVRRRLYRLAAHRIGPHVVMAGGGQSGAAPDPPGGRPGPTIDGVYENVDDRPAPPSDGMPPPHGGWDQRS